MMQDDDEAGAGPAGKDEAQPGMVVRQVPAVTRAIAVLRLLSRSEAPLGVQAIARQLGLIPSTCLHIMRALVAEEMVAFDPHTKRYRLASGIVALARGMLRHDPFSKLVEPALDEISQRYSITAIGVEAASLDHMIVVAIARPSQALHLEADLGSRYPALISATGRLVAAFGGYSRAELDKRFKVLRWQNPPALEDWRADVEACRRLGYAVDEGHYIAGVTIVAAPVLVHGRMSHALVAAGVSDQMRRSGHEALGEELKRNADELSRRLAAF
ncbi:IclR family transcriptional regulator [Aquabacter cavernae]|uniref:IclR family transcriptional regulator n=1 Tax=Aquabacter cavernae TaxID=2496029 RepID=UPI001FE01BD1|nr:IclR family transcriptional regulator [Aquabacter cavernae]